MLCGSNNAKVTKLRLNKLSTFGLLKHLKQEEVLAVIDALIAAAVSAADRRGPLSAGGRVDGIRRRGDEGQGIAGRPLPVPADLLVETARKQGEGEGREGGGAKGRLASGKSRPNQRRLLAAEPPAPRPPRCRSRSRDSRSALKQWRERDCRRGGRAAATTSSATTRSPSWPAVGRPTRERASGDQGHRSGQGGTLRGHAAGDRWQGARQRGEGRGDERRPAFSGQSAAENEHGSAGSPASDRFSPTPTTGRGGCWRPASRSTSAWPSAVCRRETVLEHARLAGDESK